MSGKIEIWSDLDKLPDLVSTLRDQRRDFETALGRARDLYCCSCGRLIGYVSVGTEASQLCGSCAKGEGLPLPVAPNVSIKCSGIGCVATASVPREDADRIVYYCDPCEARMQNHPPLRMITPVEERALKLTRS